MSETPGERPSNSHPETPGGDAPAAEATSHARRAVRRRRAGLTPRCSGPAGGCRVAGPSQRIGARLPALPAVRSAAAADLRRSAGAGSAVRDRPSVRADQGQTQPTVPFDRPATGAVPVGAPAGTRTDDGAAKKKGAGKVVGLIVAAAIVGGASGLGGAYAGVNLFAPTGSGPAAGPSTVTVNNSDSVNQTTAIAGKVLPSVVTIEAVGTNGAGTGSGVVLTSDGYVVTNTHVVTLDGATADAAIRVTTSDGRVYDAEIVGTDPTYDLAVIKLTDAEGLTPVEFADSSELNVGDQTIAVGAPLGLSNTVTTGIVSALNRSIQIASAAAPDAGSGEGETPDEAPAPEEGETPPFFFDFGEGDTQSQTPTESISIAVIQTDAAINPGNSGGALVDEDGKLIGINVAIATAGGATEAGSIGVGFSIPSNIVQRVTDEIIESGAATHGLLGASVRDAAAVEDSTMTGAYIAEVVADGAALRQPASRRATSSRRSTTSRSPTRPTSRPRSGRRQQAARRPSRSSATVRPQTVEVTLGELPL